MPYHCSNGTSTTSCIVACECAMSTIQSGAILCQPSTSTVDSMSWFIKIYKCINEMDFVIFWNICLQSRAWPHLWKSLQFRIWKTTDRCKFGFAPGIHWTSASKWCGYMGASKWQTRSNIVQMQLPQIQAYSQHLLEQSLCWCIICQSLGPPQHIADGIEIVYKNPYHPYMATWLLKKRDMLFCLLTCLPINSRFLASMHLLKTSQHLVPSNHNILCLTWCVPSFCALQQVWWKSADLCTPGWTNTLHRHLH